ncbi:unnamed protein product [marine sediment metagenome]|uniref:Uncharacterized protein n=1 Tax=marine sediment metagenome TaxID=412755 RepID=X0TJE1_9ZZZZ
MRDHGMEGLLVIDELMRLKTIGVITNAPTIMIANKAAEII